jgi:hypothetical protein
MVVNGLAQNLVPNFGFEQYSTCPSTEDQVQFCDGWSKYSASSTTPDYYNDCSSSSTMGVPQNASFYQPDNRNCGAYMALYTWTNPIMNYREHIGVQLSQPLVIGQKYFLSFYTVLTTQDDFSTPSNNIGMRLSTIPFNSTNPTPVDNFAHLRSVSIVTDTANWVRISGSIVADSAYNYLILGNFYDDANTDTLTQTCGTCQNVASYYLVDDVCVSTDSTLCNGGVDLLPCNVSVEEYGFENQINIYPNPANDLINITKEHEVKDINISIYNSLGQTLYTEKKINSNNKQIDIGSYNNGLLFIKIESDNNQFTYKLLKQ